MIDYFKVDDYIFYSINNDEDNKYILIVANNKIHSFIETEFKLKMNINAKLVVSVLSEEAPTFEKLAAESSLYVEKLDVAILYKQYLKERFNFSDEFMSYDSFFEFGEFKVDEIPNYPVSLVEADIKHSGYTPKDFIIFYVHSNEDGVEHYPHVHVKVRGKSYDYCSINIVNCKILAKCKQADESTINKILKQLKENIDIARVVWNEHSKSMLYFKSDESGNLTNIVEKRKK